MGDHTFYATLVLDPNHVPHSWLEMSFWGQALVFSAVVEGRNVVILVQNLTFLAEVVSKRMRLVVQTYNNHLWLSTVLQPPMSISPAPILSPSDMREPTLQPSSVLPNLDPLSPTLPFLYPHQIPEENIPPWNSVGSPSIFQTIVNSEARESPPPG